MRPQSAGNQPTVTVCADFGSYKVAVIIPAFNEQESLPLVLDDLPQQLLFEVIVVDNGSSDETAARAAKHGARVVSEKRKGYGSACLAGIAALSTEVDLVVFLDGDHSDHPEQITEVAAPIVAGEMDMVIGSRMNNGCEQGALLPQAAFGNRLAVTLIRWFFGHQYSDLGPFRAISRQALEQLQMRDTNFGWTVEMQIKAIRHQLRICEVPVRYRKRVGQSKITGTINGTIKAGYKILFTIFKYGLFDRRVPEEKGTKKSTK